MSKRGAAIWQRRTALGISRRTLAEAAGIDRTTLRRAEEDRPAVRDTTYGVLEATLDRLENPPAPPREMTPEEEAALLILVRGGWLTFQWASVAPVPHFQLDRDGTVWQNVPRPVDDAGSPGIEGEVVSETE